MPGRVSVGHVQAEECVHARGPFGVRLAIGVEPTGYIRVGINAHAGGNDIADQRIEPLRRELVAAGQNQRAGVRISARVELPFVDESWRVTESLHAAPEEAVFLIRARPDHVTVDPPEELDVCDGIGGSAKQMIHVDLFHPSKRLEDVSVDGALDQSIRLDDAEPLFARAQVGVPPVIPSEDVDAGGPGHQRLPKLAGQRGGIAIWLFSEKRVRGAMAGLGDEDGQAGLVAMPDDPELAGAEFAAFAGPCIIVNRPEVQRGARGYAPFDNSPVIFAGVVGVEPVVNPANHRVADQMVRVRLFCSDRADGDEISDAFLPPLDQVVVGGEVAVCVSGVELRHHHVIERGVIGLPVAVQRSDGVAVKIGQEAPERGERIVGVEPNEQVWAGGVVPQVEVRVLVAEDPAGDGFAVFVTARDARNKIGVGRPCAGMLVVQQAGRTITGVDRFPTRGKPAGWVLISNQREDSKSVFFRLVDNVVGHRPVEGSVGGFDLSPCEVYTEGIGVNFPHLQKIIIDLRLGLTGADRGVDGLIGKAVGHPIIGGHRVPKVPVR